MRIMQGLLRRSLEDPLGAYGFRGADPPHSDPGCRNAPRIALRWGGICG
jgi:hypothetical protein